MRKILVSLAAAVGLSLGIVSVSSAVGASSLNTVNIDSGEQTIIPSP
jgi:hypothetical protein